MSAPNRLTAEAIKAETLRLHDLRYGNAHCERKWVEICPKYQELIFPASQNFGDPVQPEPAATPDAAGANKDGAR